MFSAVIRYLYCLRDLLFLPGINHCQQDRGSKVVKVKSPKAIPELKGSGMALADAMGLENA